MMLISLSREGSETMDINALCIPECVEIEKTLTLSKEISAMELVRRESGAARLGAIAALPKGSQVDVCGPGFNDRTFKVRYENRFFFVFLQDVEPSRLKGAYAAATHA
jgi:hypothetical protein